MNESADSEKSEKLDQIHKQFVVISGSNSEDQTVPVPLIQTLILWPIFHNTILNLDKEQLSLILYSFGMSLCVDGEIVGGWILISGDPFEVDEFLDGVNVGHVLDFDDVSFHKPAQIRKAAQTVP
jgi:hypothetical protein